jgi:hypothetical protein
MHVWSEAGLASKLNRGFASPDMKLIYRSQILGFEVVDILSRLSKSGENDIPQVLSGVMLYNVVIKRIGLRNCSLLLST